MVVVLGTGGQALASAGCSAVNSGEFTAFADETTPPTSSGSEITIPNFAVGDTITFTITIATGAGNPRWSLGAGSNDSNIASASASATRSYTITGNPIGGQADTTLSQLVTINLDPGRVSVTATCTAAAATGPTDSQKLGSLVSIGSQIIANVSGQAVTNAVQGSINDAFSNGGSWFTGSSSALHWNFAAEPAAAQTPHDPRIDDAYAALGYAAGMPVKAPPPAAVPVWLPWVDVRGTGFDRDDAAAGMQDRQVNATAGIGHLLSPDLLVGVFTGYETYRLTIASLTGTLNGNGGTVGAYAAWRLAPHWRVDGLFGWTGLEDHATAGTASGSFGGSRWLASGGFTGNYRTGTLLFEPSSNVYALWERDGEFTDTLGTLQPQSNFSAGRIATGGKLSDPLPWSGSFIVSPYVGMYGDWYWGTSTAIPAGTPLVGFGDGWSGRVTGGVMAARAAGGTLSLGGEYGGLGAAYKVWTASARLQWPF